MFTNHLIQIDTAIFRIQNIQWKYKNITEAIHLVYDSSNINLLRVNITTITLTKMGNNILECHL